MDCRFLLIIYIIDITVNVTEAGKKSSDFLYDDDSEERSNNSNQETIEQYDDDHKQYSKELDTSDFKNNDETDYFTNNEKEKSMEEQNIDDNGTSADNIVGTTRPVLNNYGINNISEVLNNSSNYDYFAYDDSEELDKSKHHYRIQYDSYQNESQGNHKKNNKEVYSNEDNYDEIENKTIDTLQTNDTDDDNPLGDYNDDFSINLETIKSKQDKTRRFDVKIKTREQLERLIGKFVIEFLMSKLQFAKEHIADVLRNKSKDHNLSINTSFAY